jgi:hypothetical protein
MTGRARSLAPWAVAAVIGAVAMIWIDAWMISLNDYGFEASPALNALLHGDFSSFLTLAPAYGASLELRAPFALVASISGGGQLEIYRASAVPCGLAAAGLGVWLVMRMGRRGSGLLARLCVLGVCVLNPITYKALAFGHPEELLGGALCVAAVLCAERDHPAWAGLLLGLAIANKEWALVAAGPVLVALPTRRPTAILVAATTAVALLLPIVLAAPGGFAGSTGRLATQTGDTFHPFQVWWFLGPRIHWIPAMAGSIPKGARDTPAWLAGRAHMLVVGVSVPLTLLYHRSRQPSPSPLLLLALLLLLRCVLDPWDIAYYPLPFIIALVSWESVSAAPRAPARSILATLATWIVFVVLPKHVGVDDQSIAFLVVALPALVLLGRSLYRPLIARQSVGRRPGMLATSP